MKLTKTAKRYIQLDEQILNNQKKAEKFESGYYYNPIKRYAYEDRVKIAVEKQNALVLNDADKDSIEFYYQCAEMFERD